MSVTSNSKMRILIAGGAGFIGSNLAERLLDLGHKVDCIDNLITGQRQNIAACEISPRFEFVPGDICDIAFMARFNGIPYNAIYNLACPTGVPNIAKFGEEMLMTSSVGNLNLLKLANLSGAKFLYASSAEVYGDPAITPQSEVYFGDVNPVGPRSAYEEAKRFGESLTKHFSTMHAVDARIIRIFNTYGPKMSLRETRVIPQLLRNMILKVPVTLYGDGSNTRSFQFVDDLLAGFEASMNVICAGDVFNIGGEHEISMLELFRNCQTVAKYDEEPVFKEHFIEDHRRRRPETKKIRELGWKPKVQLIDGLGLCHKDLSGRLLTQPIPFVRPQKITPFKNRRVIYERRTSA